MIGFVYCEKARIGTTDVQSWLKRSVPLTNEKLSIINQLGKDDLHRGGAYRRTKNSVIA